MILIEVTEKEVLQFCMSENGKRHTPWSMRGYGARSDSSKKIFENPIPSKINEVHN